MIAPGRYEQPAPQPILSAEQWKVIHDLIRWISVCCHFGRQAKFAAEERIWLAFGLCGVGELRPEHFDEPRPTWRG